MNEEFSNNPIMRLQMKMRELQEEISAIRAEGSSDDGTVKVVFAGGTGFESVKIAPDSVSVAKKKELEEKLLAASRSAVQVVLKAVEAKTIALHKDLGLP